MRFDRITWFEWFALTSFAITFVLYAVAQNNPKLRASRLSVHVPRSLMMFALALLSLLAIWAMGRFLT